MVLTMPESNVHAPSGAAGGPFGGPCGGPAAGLPGGSAGGSGAWNDSGAALRDAIGTLRGGADVQVCPIAMPGDLDGALHRRGSRTIVIAGGDAGLHSVVSALHRRNELDDAVLAMIPAGPGGENSAFARGAGIPTTPELAARAVLNRHERRFDMLMDCRGEVVVNGARVAGRPDRRSRALTGLGSVSGFGAFEQLASRPLRVQVVADDEVITDLDRPVLQVQVNNCPSSHPYAGAQADPCDGYADVVVSFASRGLRRVRHAIRTGQQVRRARSARPEYVPVGWSGPTEVTVNSARERMPDLAGVHGVPDASGMPSTPDGSNGTDGSGYAALVDLPEERLGTHADVLRLRARTVSVAGQWFALASDGKDAGAEQRCTWRVLPERLRVIVPAPLS